jgi:hypothetical protein
VVECIGDHVRLLDNLSDDATLTQEIVVSSVFPIKTTSLTTPYVAFRSQSLLKSTSDQTGSDTN